ncbi:MAG: TIGR04372 family glycosyltransferase [Oligoflexia bacterium]|nr:TIGR04372 family glycosyltransferase [Oligoflexia bacterium]
MHENSGQEAAFWKKICELSPAWTEAHERAGDAWLGLNNFERGLEAWRNAMAYQPTPDTARLSELQLQDWWSFESRWDGNPPDRYPDLYTRSVQLLHHKQFDAHLDILKVGMEAQENFARRHQLDKFGLWFLREWTYAIGHIALLDLYVKMGILGLRREGIPVVLEPQPANACYLEYWRKYIPGIITNPEGVNMLKPLGERLEEHLHLVTMRDGRRLYHVAALSEVERLWRASGRGPLLKLTDEHVERGRSALEKLGVPREAWFVGLHIRHTGNNNSRNAALEAYRPAIESIGARGGFVLRMGDRSMPNAPAMPNLIDYVHSDAYSDWMDVFIWGASRFYIGTNSGPILVPSTFGVPCVATNIAPIMASSPIVNGDNIGIYKTYWSKERRVHLPFAEVMESSLGMSESPERLSELGLELQDNSPAEINEAVIEMMERIENTASYTTSDEEFQTKFKLLKPKTRYAHGYPHGRLGRDFLRRYKDLL